MVKLHVIIIARKLCGQIIVCDNNKIYIIHIIHNYENISATIKTDDIDTRF